MNKLKVLLVCATMSMLMLALPAAYAFVDQTYQEPAYSYRVRVYVPPSNSQYLPKTLQACRIAFKYHQDALASQTARPVKFEWNSVIFNPSSVSSVKQKYSSATVHGYIVTEIQSTRGNGTYYIREPVRIEIKFNMCYISRVNMFFDTYQPGISWSEKLQLIN